MFEGVLEANVICFWDKDQADFTSVGSKKTQPFTLINKNMPISLGKIMDCSACVAKGMAWIDWGTFFAGECEANCDNAIDVSCATNQEGCDSISAFDESKPICNAVNTQFDKSCDLCLNTNEHCSWELEHNVCAARDFGGDIPSGFAYSLTDCRNCFCFFIYFNFV